MSKNRDEKGRFVEGNEEQLKYSLETAKNSFMGILDFALQNKSYSVEEAIIMSGIIPYSTFYHLLKRYPELEAIKQDIFSVIRMHVNRLGMDGHINATLSIWRLKQLGETDKQERIIEDKRDNVKNLFPTDDELMDD